jgi:molybdate transport system ATP-binding protein
MLEFSARLTLSAAFTLDASFKCPAGITALFGPSGTGKSTLVNIIAGLQKPNSGQIKINGETLFDAEKQINLAPEARHVGYVFQDALLFPHLNVAQNLRYGLKQRRAEPLIAFDELCHLLGIEALLRRKPATLSGGEQRRVAIGRALLSAPRLLLLDEPTAGLDARRRSEVLKLLRQLQQKTGIPILFISHQLEEVIEIASQIIILEDGRVVADTDLFDALSRPDLRRHTGQQDAGAVIAAEVAETDAGDGLSRLSFDGGELWTGRIDAEPGTLVRVRIRAADIALALEPPVDTSVLNVFNAEIETISHTSDPHASDHQADLLLRVGQAALWARITKRSLRNLGLQPGMRVHALIKAVAIDRSGSR